MAERAGQTHRIYERYGEFRPHHIPPSKPSDLLSGRGPVFRKLFVPHLPPRRDAEILDIGCGYGEFVSFLQRDGFTRVSGIDLDADEVERGSRFGVSNLRCGDARRFLVQHNACFDCVSALDMLEHVPRSETLEFLDLVYGALKPGGRFLCQVPNLAAFYAPLFFMDFSHETPYTASSLKQVLELANFARVRVYPMGPVVHGFRSAVRAVLWRGITVALWSLQTIEGGPRDPLSSIFTAAIFAVAERF
jgi:2-polyprenyl-3-methyl-5-hydroxy-6-metoxy-1,4-benzoquinol methylase